MLSDSVAQNPTIAVSDGKNALRNSGVVAKRLGCDRIGPNPPALVVAQPSSASPTTIRNGAAKLSSHLMLSVPLRMNHTFIAQNTRNPSASPVESPSPDGRIAGSVAMPGHIVLASW
jgi:hypothetical protein